MSQTPQRGEWDAAEQVMRGLPRDASILLVCHVNPDGDAIGSMIGFGLGLRRLGYTRLVASFPGALEVPASLGWLPGLDLLVAEDDVVETLDTTPDIVIAFDAASLARLGKLGAILSAAPLSIVLDHHASNDRYGRINLVDSGAPATAVVAERLLEILGVELMPEIAECLYVALATDTGSFRFTCTPVAHQLAARLIASGIDAGEISRKLFDNRPFGAVRLFGDALCRVELDRAAAGGLGMVWTYATLADLARYGQHPYVLEPLIDAIRCAEEAEVACLVKQVRPTEWSVSLRSRGGVDVSTVAVALGGGGHRSAAGFTWHGTVADVVSAVRDQLAIDGDSVSAKIGVS